MKVKTFAAAVLLVGSLTWAALIIINTKSKTVDLNFEPTSSKAENFYDLSSAPYQPANLTEVLTERIAEEIVANVPQAELQNPQSIQASLDKITEKILSENLTALTKEDLKPEVDLKDLRLSSDNSAEAKNLYAKNFQDIFIKHFRQFQPDATGDSLKNLAELSRIYQKIIDELYLLPVPDSIASLHQEGIRLLGAQKNILDRLVNNENDPLGALAAANQLPNINNDMANFKNKLSNLLLPNL